MSVKYKIGDIAKLMNIPMANLRFYEEKGIINPLKDKQNGYRYYDSWNMNNLLDTLQLRSLDFSLNQIEKMLKEANLQEITDEFIDQEKYILERLNHYQNMLEVISKQKIRLQYLNQYLNKFKECKSPALIFHGHRLKDSYQTVSGSKNISELNHDLQRWLQLIPKDTATFYIPLEELNNKKPENIEYWWGFSAPSEIALNNGIKAISPNQLLPVTNCLYTVFEAGKRGTFITAFYHNVYQKIIDQGYVISSSPFGRLIIKTHEDNVFKRYFEAWIPIVK